MKKLKYKFLNVMAFSVIMLFMSSSVLAQVQESQQDTTAQDTTTQQQTMPQEQNQRIGDTSSSQEPDQGVDYSETIEQNELPQEVNSSLDELYPAHEVQEAYRGDDDSYKVKVKNEDDEAVVYYDSEGKFLRAENLSGLNQEGALPQEQGQRTMDSQEQEQMGTDNRKNQQGTQQGQYGTEETQQTQQNQQGAQKDTVQGQWGTQADDKNERMKDDGSAYPQEQNQRTGDELRSQNYDKDVDYSETIQESDLPQEVTSSLDELYPAHEVQEAYQGEDDSYKIKLKNEDDEAVVYYDSKGEFLRAENLSGLQQEGALPQEQGQRTQERDNAQQNMQSTHQEMHNQQGAQQEQWESDTAKNKSSAYPQEQSQRMREDMRSQMHDMGMKYSEKLDKSELPEEVTNSIDEMYPENEISEVYRGEDDTYKVKLNIQDDETVVFFDDKGEFLRVGKDDQQQASPQEQNQRINNVEESQDADRWGTENRSLDYGTDTVSADTVRDEWEYESDTLNEDSAFPQEQNQQIEGDQDEEQLDDNWGTEDMGAHQSTWDDEESPQEQNQQTTEENELEMQGDSRTEDDAWDATDTTDTRETYGTSPGDTTETYNDQMMEDNTLDGDDTNRMDGTASPQDQSQRTGDEDVDYSQEMQENELPETVTNSLDELYPDHEIEEAYRGDDGSYKVKVKNDDDKVAVYYDSNGLFQRDENLNDMHKDKNKDTNQDW